VTIATALLLVGLLQTLAVVAKQPGFPFSGTKYPFRYFLNMIPFVAIRWYYRLERSPLSSSYAGSFMARRCLFGNNSTNAGRVLVYTVLWRRYGPSNGWWFCHQSLLPFASIIEVVPSPFTSRTALRTALMTEELSWTLAIFRRFLILETFLQNFMFFGKCCVVFHFRVKDADLGVCGRDADVFFVIIIRVWIYFYS